MKKPIEFCRVCKKKELNLQHGILCNLTGEKPSFEESCPDFEMNEEEYAQRFEQKMSAAGEVESPEGFTPQLHITLGVIAIIVGSTISIGSLLFPLGGYVVFFYGIIGYGIFSIVKGVNQKKIIAEYVEFEEKLQENKK